MEDSESNYKTIYIRNLDKTIDENILKCIFGEYGNITKAKLVRNPNGTSRGFAFMTFNDHESAKMAIKCSDGTLLNGKSLYVARAKTKLEIGRMVNEMSLNDNPNANLYVKQLDSRVDDNFLNTFFSVYGTVLSAKVMRYPDGESRGFGFVSFTNPEDAKRALQNLNGRMIFTKPLYVSIAQRSEERKAMLAAAWSARKRDAFEERQSRNAHFSDQTKMDEITSKERNEESMSNKLFWNRYM